MWVATYLGTLVCGGNAAQNTCSRNVRSTVRNTVRLKIIGNEMIKNVGKSQSCMVSKLPIIFKRTRTYMANQPAPGRQPKRCWRAGGLLKALLRCRARCRQSLQAQPAPHQTPTQYVNTHSDLRSWLKNQYGMWRALHEPVNVCT